jgi:DNA-binding transcriptional LysR family regulator
VSRAIAFLEAQVGAPLLHRTTRSLKMSEAGAQYALACRRVLTDLEEAIIIAAGAQSAPRGTLALTAPLLCGETILRPIVDAFLDGTPAISARLHLLDRVVNLIDEGFDIALRMAYLADSAFVAIRLGEVRRVVVAAPDYLAHHPAVEDPRDLAGHQIVAYAPFGQDSWSFPPLPGGSVARTVAFTPRLLINTARGAVSSAAAGRGITRVFSYQAAAFRRRGELEIILKDHEYPPVPVHLIIPPGRLSVPKVRAFVDFAVPRLRCHFARLPQDLVATASPLQRHAVSAG